MCLLYNYIFLFTGFSLLEWKLTNKLQPANLLVEPYPSILLDYLGLSSYMNPTPCSVQQNQYKNGWKNGIIPVFKHANTISNIFNDRYTKNYHYYTILSTFTLKLPSSKIFFQFIFN